MPQYNVTGIVLRRIAFGETDNILTLYTRERGRVSAIAKGARKAGSRTAGACETLTCSRYNLAAGKSLEVITQAEVKNSFPRLRKDLGRLAAGQYLAEVVDKFAVDEDPHPELFTLLRSALLLLERASDTQTAARWFEIRLLDEAGFAPDLLCCGECGEPAPSDTSSTDAVYALSIKQGAVLCPLHAASGASSDLAPLSLDALDFLQHVNAHTIGHVRAVLAIEPPAARTATLARHAMRRYIRWRIDSDLRSAAFMDSVNAAAAFTPEPARPSQPTHPKSEESG